MKHPRHTLCACNHHLLVVHWNRTESDMNEQDATVRIPVRRLCQLSSSVGKKNRRREQNRNNTRRMCRRQRRRRLRSGPCRRPQIDEGSKALLFLLQWKRRITKNTCFLLLNCFLLPLFISLSVCCGDSGCGQSRHVTGYKQVCDVTGQWYGVSIIIYCHC